MRLQRARGNEVREAGKLLRLLDARLDNQPDPR